ncbi:MAG: hypothetical protein U5K70_02870 [Halodesulfurarchaeum sp.]|nr:hypothetical protein [Halodesulfurarchaeum sp.]
MDENGTSYKSDQDSLPLDNGIFVGIIAGVLHGSIALGLWYSFEFESVPKMLSTEPLFMGYVLLGMFALGFVPGLLYAKLGSVSPALLIGGLLLVSAYGTWMIVGDNLTPVGPTPFGWYVLFWVGSIALISVVGWGEVTLLQRNNKNPQRTK